MESYNILMNWHEGQLSDCDKVLDVGAGIGRLSEKLLKKEKEVVAIDTNVYGLKLLRERMVDRKDRLQTMAMDASMLSFADDSFDGINAMLVLPFIKNPVSFLNEVKRVLKVNGKIVSSGLSRDSWLVMNGWFKELDGCGRFEGVEKNWDNIFYKLNMEIKNHVHNWCNAHDIRKLFEEAGLKVEYIGDNPLYRGNGYCVTARK